MDHLETEIEDLHQGLVRLNKFLALSGVGSRRKNDELILSGVVKVNGKIVKELGTKIDAAHDRVTVNGKPVAQARRFLYILLNKPKDTITTLNDERGRHTVMDYVRVRERVYPVGRLDRGTTGVLLLTNDGELAHALTHPRFEIEKLYRARLDKGMLDEDLKKIRKGVRLTDGVARAHQISVIPGTKRQEILIAVHEGRNRLVRRMFEALGYEVKRLERLQFAGLTTQGVARGKWRHLSRDEVRYLRQLIRSRTNAEKP